MLQAALSVNSYAEREFFVSKMAIYLFLLCVIFLLFSLIAPLLPNYCVYSRSTYLSLMTALEREGRWAEAVSQIRNMKAVHLPLDVVVYSAAISACERGAAWREALELLADMQAEGI